MRPAFEILLLLFQFIFVIVLFVFVPLLWYSLVNKLSLKDILARLQLRREGITRALFWGMITVVLIFIILMIIGAVLLYIGYNLEGESNITDLEQIFSLAPLVVLITLQPICEEIFFRGFLLEKLHALAGKEVAIVLTGVLFGISHLTYGKIYPAVLTAIIGMIFALLVIKTKNLYSSIFAHIVYNVISFTLYLYGKSLGI
jgi:membrane protease YdiL (CAAX protease family)